MHYSSIIQLLIVAFCCSIAIADQCPSGPAATNTTSGGMIYTYPYPIQYAQLQTQHQSLCQAYMDVSPPSTASQNYTGPQRTVVLLHGKNFCGATWNATAEELLSQGYRVVLPDQLGFCKSDKPDAYQFSLQQFALNTKTILNSLNLTSVYVLGHSMGGMLATRFALMYPDMVAGLMLVNPIGLEDWKAKGVPYLSIDNIYTTERASNYTSIRGYEQATYYVNSWSPAYDVWVNMLLAVYNGSRAEIYAFDQALVTDMVMTQPIAYEFSLLANTPTLLMIGEKDNTAIGKQWSPPAVAAKLGNYTVLGRATADAIGENCTYVPFSDLGHAPQIQEPDRFHDAVVSWLGSH